MRNKLPFFLALGAGLGLLTALRRRTRQERARRWLGSQPGTAVVTGASAGIGAVFARALAREGYKLLIMARREDRLAALAQELEQAYGVQARFLAVDLADPADLERAALEVGSIPDLDILVNNAGFGTGGRFDRLDVQTELKMVRLHIEASMRLAHAALPGMIERHHGGIINLSSMASFIPLPGNVTYAATKSYLNFFTGGLNVDLAGSGVRVQALCPGFTYSEFHDVANVRQKMVPGFMWMNAEPVVEASLRGLREGREIVIPGLVNRLEYLALRFLPVGPIARLVKAWWM